MPRKDKVVEKLSSRERVIRAITFQNPDRVPVMHAILPGGWYKHGQALYEILKRYPGDLSQEQVMATKGRPAASGYHYSEDLQKAFVLNDDFSYFEPRHFQYGTPGAAGLRRDEWGCVWAKLDPGIVGQVIEHPLADWEAVKHFRFPDPEAYWRFDTPAIKEDIRLARKQGKYVIVYAGNLFELLQWLRGYENLLIDIVQAPDRVRYLADRIVEYNLKTIEQWCQYDADGVHFQDDWGTQTQLMINPNYWQEIFKPYYKQMFDAVHAGGMHVHFHTDGHTIDIISDLIEIGVDVLNPQFSAMDLDELARVAAGKVCIRTDIDRQYILPQASLEEVREYIKKVIRLFASQNGGLINGGLIACGEINADASLENVEVMYETFEQYGRYPIRL